MLKRGVEDAELGPKGPISRAVAVTPAQSAVLELLRDSDPRPLTVAEIAGRLGQHPNTTREHVDALVEAGLVVTAAVRSGARGRPSQEYAVAEDPAPAMSLRLIEALATLAASTSVDPQVGVDLGYAAGAAVEVSGRVASRGLLPYLEQMLRGWGFSTVPTEGDAGVDVVRCPLVDAARSAPEIVCGFHRGVIRGLVAQAGVDPDDVTLVEFDRPGSCRLVLAHR